ncbi:MAG: manganese efflux pump [Kofleriaceae bacterium]
MLSALLLAIGLAMDAAAASAVRGMMAPVVRRRDVALVAALTGGCQAGMAALGWLAGARLGDAVARYDHWVAFVILVALGGKAVWSALAPSDDAAAAPASAPFAVRGLVILAMATSVDALAAGVTVPLLAVPGAVAIGLIGGVTALLAAIAVVIGRVIGRHLGGKLEVVGGLALIAIGTKLLVDGLAG